MCEERLELRSATRGKSRRVRREARVEACEEGLDLESVDRG